MVDLNDIPLRLAAASPLTRRILRASNAWTLVMFGIVIFAYIFATYVGSGRGVVVHPPVVVTVLAHLLAILAGAALLYAWLYFGGALRRSTVAIALLYCFLGWSFTLGGVAWGLPVLSLIAGGSERTVELRVQEIRFLHANRGRRDRGRCVGYAMIFGTWYDPGGRICVGERGAANRGATLEMEGRGNGLATRISRVTGVSEADDSGP